MRSRVASLLVALVTTTLSAQNADTTYAWADRLLVQEVTFPVITRLSQDVNAKHRLAPLNRLVEAYLLLLDTRSAKPLLELATTLQGSAPPFEIAYHHLNQSRYDFITASYASSIDQLKKVLNLTESRRTEVGEALLRTKAALQWGRSLLQLKRMKESRIKLDEAYRYFLPDSSAFAIQLAQTCLAMGLWSKVNEQFPQAIVFYKHAIRIFEASEHERYAELGKGFNNLGTVYSELGDYGNARDNYVKALDIKKQHAQDTLSLAITYNNLGVFYAGYGNNAKASEYYALSISQLNESNPRFREKLPEFLNNYGVFLLANDELVNSERNFRRCIQLLDDGRHSDEQLVAPLISLAALLLIKPDLPQARKLLARARNLLPDSSASRRMLAQWHLCMANLYNITYQLKESEEHYKLALGYSGTANTLLASEIYLRLGEFRLKKKEYRRSLADFRRSSAIVSDNLSGSYPQQSAALNRLGEAWLKAGVYDSAILAFESSIGKNLAVQEKKNNIFSTSEYVFELISSFYFLGKLHYHNYRESHDPREIDKSRGFVDLGLNVIDSRRKSLTMTNDQISFDTRISEFFELAMEVYQEDKGTAAADRIFYVSELAKSQSLGQALKESNLKSFANVSSSLKKEEERLSSSIKLLDLQMLKELNYGTDANPDLIREYEQDLVKAKQRYEVLQDSIRKNLPGYYQLKYNKTLITLGELRKDILNERPQTALLQFTTGDSAVYCQVITSGQTYFYRVADAPAIKDHIIAFRNQLKVGLTNELYENGSWLYTRLIKPAEPFLNSKKNKIKQLVVIPDQILCYLPFEALITDLAKHKYLIAKVDISYGYSATLLWQKYTERTEPRKYSSFIGLAPEFKMAEAPRPVAFRDEKEDGADRFQFQPLVGNRSEVDKISMALVKNKVRSTTLEGDKATEAGFRKLNLSDYDYVHFATHGFVDMDDPQLSGVAFSRDRDAGSFDDLLLTNEVYEMQFKAKLVCLSSCESGIGKLYRGEGMIGLAQAFLFAGARNLAVSLWKVDDLATRDLMIDFYAGIPGKDFSSALTAAKRKMLASGKYNHPAYWSSFILIGL